MKHNTAEAQDGFMQIGEGKQYDFYSVDTFSQTFTSELEGRLSTIKIRLDAQSDSYQRTVFSLLDLTGQLGGVNEVFIVIGTLFMSLFTEKLFNYSILSKVYQVDTSKDKEPVPWEVEEVDPNQKPEYEQPRLLPYKLSKRDTRGTLFAEVG